jgi:antitoxin component YwqK of YwqJK toxin-antitoxin module
MKSLIFTAIALCLLACNPSNSQEVKDNEPKPLVEKDFTEFYDNGQLKTEGKLVNGLRNGLWTSYYENGLKWSETTFKMDVKSGVTTTYYESGMMRYTGSYYNDERTGEWLFYNEDGSIMKKENFIERLNEDSISSAKSKIAE